MLAAGVVLAVGVSGAIFMTHSKGPVDALARDAIGDHWNCALKNRKVRTPVPLEEAAQRFDSVYRVLLTGIHLMRTGEVEANVVRLNEEFRLPYIVDLVARKLAGPEKSTLDDADVAFHEREYERLRGSLQSAHEASRLPALPSDETRAALNALLVRVRLQQHDIRTRQELRTVRISDER